MRFAAASSVTVCGGGRNVERVVLAFAGHDYFEAQGSGEIVEFHYGTRFVPGRRRINNPGAAGHAAEDGSDGYVCFDVQHHDVFAFVDSVEGDPRPDLGYAGRLYYHVYHFRAGDLHGIVGDAGTTGFAVYALYRLLSRFAQGGHGASGFYVGDGDYFHAGDAGDLGDKSPAHLARADESYLYRVAAAFQCFQFVS